MDLTKHKIFDLVWNAGIKEKDFCAAIGINESAMSDWKTGKTKSYRKHLQAIADYFNVSVEYLKDERPIYSDDFLSLISKIVQLPESSQHKILLLIEQEVNQRERESSP